MLSPNTGLPSLSLGTRYTHAMTQKVGLFRTRTILSPREYQVVLPPSYAPLFITGRAGHGKSTLADIYMWRYLLGGDTY